MGKDKSWKNWVTPLTVAHFFLMVNIGLNIFIKGDAIYVTTEKFGIACIIPALILWALPVLTLRRYGNIHPNGSFLATTVLVDKGMYRVIRHPQYLGFMLLSFGMGLYFQLDITIIISLLTIILLAFGIKEEEKLLVDQFGEDYEVYKKKVPALNLFTGLLKLIIKKH